MRNLFLISHVGALLENSFDSELIGFLVGDKSLFLIILLTHANRNKQTYFLFLG